MRFGAILAGIYIEGAKINNKGFLEDPDKNMFFI
jgi:hypothetical protein